MYKGGVLLQSLTRLQHAQRSATLKQMNLSVVGEEFYTDLENEIDYLKRGNMAMRDHTQSLNYAMDDMERIVYTLQEENTALQEDNHRAQKELKVLINQGI